MLRGDMQGKYLNETIVVGPNGTIIEALPKADHEAEMERIRVAMTKYENAKSKEGAKLDDGCKLDAGKPDWSLLPLKMLEPVVKVLTFGMRKYGRENWKLVHNAKHRYYAAMQRHLMAWQSGEQMDSESSESHLAHAACCLLFLMWFDSQAVETDAIFNEIEQWR